MDLSRFLTRFSEPVQRAVTDFALGRLTLSGVLPFAPPVAMFARMLVAFGADEAEVRRAMGEVRALAAVPEAFGRLARETLAKAKAETEPAKARAVYYRATLYAFAADWFTLDDDAKAASYGLVREAFDPYRALADPPVARVEIRNGDLTTPGAFRLPPGETPRGAVLIVQGFDSSKELWARMEEALLARGIATLGIDQPGAGEALAMGQKLRGEAPILAAADAALGWLRTHPAIDAARIGVLGYSLGGYVAPRVAAEFPDRVAALCGVGGPYDLSFWHRLPIHFRMRSYFAAGARNEAELAPLLKRLDLTGRLRRVRCPALVLHGEADAIVPPAHARMIHDELGGPKELRIVREGDHALSARYGAEVVPAVADFFARTLGG